MSELREKMKEVLGAVLPVVVIVLLLHATVAPLSGSLLKSFFVGGCLVVPGLAIFLFGIEQSIDRIGRDIGNVIARSGRLSVVVISGLILGFMISFAEPDLHILGAQIEGVTAGRLPRVMLAVTVSCGIAVMMTLGLLRILKGIKLNIVFFIAYGIIFAMALFSIPEFLAIAFDSSGATTGALTTPFILALSIGVSSMKRNSKAGEEDSFGLIGLASSGAILAVLLTGLIMHPATLEGTEEMVTEAAQSGIVARYAALLSQSALETLPALAPVALAYTFFEIFCFKRGRKRTAPLYKGLLMTYIGLVLFLTGVNGGFMQVGRAVGMTLAALPNKIPLLFVSLLLGVVTVLAEPAVIVLTHQIEETTGGYVRRPLVLIFLSAAVGVAVLIAVMRILLPSLKLWMLLLPGFGAAVWMAFRVPVLFVGMGFDAGGVASGPMTATFIMAFVQGVAIQTPTADIVRDGFGMIAVVAMMPIVAVQVLGLIYQAKTRKLKERK